MSTEQLQIPVWTWRDAVRKSAIQPLTKLVLYSIANYLTDVGTGCFPSIRTLMADSGLSNRSLATHIRAAVDAGLLVIERRSGPDGRFQRTLYLPRFPDNACLPRVSAMQNTHDEAAEDDLEADELEDGQVNELHAARPSEGASPGPRELHRVNLVHIEESNKELSKDPLTPASGGSSVDRSGDEAGTCGGRMATAGPPPPSIRQPANDHRPANDRQREWLAALRADPRDAAVVEHLLAPLLTERRFSSDRPLDDLRAAASLARGLPTPALARAWGLIRDATHQGKPLTTIKPGRLREAIATVRKGGALFQLRHGTPQWRRWHEHLAAADPTQAALIRKHDGWLVPSEWPPSPAAASTADNRETAA